MKAFKGMCAATGPSRRTLHRLLAALALLAAVVIGFSLTVFAYFSDSLVNAGNTITAGWFSADLAVVADAEQPAEGDNLLDENNGIQGIDKTVTLDGYARQTVHVRLSACADSTVAFQFRLTVEGGGQVLLTVPETGDNPVLEPGGKALTYAVSVPDDGRLTLHLETAFCAAELTGAPTATTAPAGNALTGDEPTDTPDDTDGSTTTSAQADTTSAETSGTTAETTAETAAPTVPETGGSGDTQPSADPTGGGITGDEESAAGGQTTESSAGTDPTSADPSDPTTDPSAPTDSADTPAGEDGSNPSADPAD